MATRALLVMMALVIAAGYGASGSARAVSTASYYVLLYIDQKQAVVGNEEVELAVAPTIIDGSTYVPARFLGETLGFPVDWSEETRSITLAPQNHRIVMNVDQLTIQQDDAIVPFDSVAAIIDGSLVVKLTWLADMTGTSYAYNEELNRVEMLVLKTPDGIYITDQQNSKPVAKFATSKKVYRPGEPVKYIDLSYDPDAEGLVEFKWTGNKEAFFRAGKYPVKLQVTDGHGNQSSVFTEYVTVAGTPYLSEFEFPIYNKPVGSFIKTGGWSGYYTHFDSIPQLDKTATYDKERTLLVSDCPEEIREPGILYQDMVNGKSRLYAHHINMSGQSVTFMVYATNPSTQPVTITTTNEGEVWPSIYANLIGSEATVDFLVKKDMKKEMVIPPGKTYTYVQMPTFLPGQGANVIYDVETDGPIRFTFAAQLTNAMVPPSKLKPIMSTDFIRGTFPSADVSWNADLGRSLEKPVKLSIGNVASDTFLTGIDALTKQPSENFGNWGVVYDIHLKNPPKMAIMFMAKGGYFKGPVKVNEEIVLVPQSGVLTAFDGVILLGRTTGKEASLDLEFSPPGGSNLPVDIILYPLQDLE
jgi:hypothetical protein